MHWVALFTWSQGYYDFFYYRYFKNLDLNCNPTSVRNIICHYTISYIPWFLICFFLYMLMEISHLSFWLWMTDFNFHCILEIFVVVLYSCRCEIVNIQHIMNICAFCSGLGYDLYPTYLNREKLPWKFADIINFTKGPSMLVLGRRTLSGGKCSTSSIKIFNLLKCNCGWLVHWSLQTWRVREAPITWHFFLRITGVQGHWT